MRWHLILEDFVPELKYIKGENNVVSEALSCLEMSDNQDILNISELERHNDVNLPDSAYPISHHNISKAQKTDVNHKDYTIDTCCGDNQNHRLICRNSKICLPTALQKKTVYWYHEMLCHPGETCIEHTLSQHFDCKGLHTTFHDVCKKCPTCQRAKKLIRSMASCHLNRLKQIPGTHSFEK